MITSKHIKSLSVLCSTLLLGLAGIYPIIGAQKSFWYFLGGTLVINLLAILLIVGPKTKSLKQNWDFFILPILYIIGAFFFATYFPNIAVEVFIALLFGTGLNFIYKSLLACHEKKMALPVLYRNLLTMLVLVTFFLCSVLIFNFYLYWQLPVIYMVLAHFAVTFGLNHFMTKQMLVAPNLYSNLYNIVISLSISELAWSLSFWSVNYPSVSTQNTFSHLGIPVASLITMIGYYCIWGVVYYLIEGRLTRKVIYEYLGISFFMVIMILITTKWLPAI